MLFELHSLPIRLLSLLLLLRPLLYKQFPLPFQHPLWPVLPLSGQLLLSELPVSLLPFPRLLLTELLLRLPSPSLLLSGQLLLYPLHHLPCLLQLLPLLAQPQRLAVPFGLYGWHPQHPVLLSLLLPALSLPLPALFSLPARLPSAPLPRLQPPYGHFMKSLS